MNSPTGTNETRMTKQKQRQTLTDLRKEARLTDIRRGENGRIILKDRELVRRMRRQKKAVMRAKGNHKLQALATSRKRETRTPTHMICNGTKTSDKTLWLEEIHRASTTKFTATEEKEKEKE